MGDARPTLLTTGASGTVEGHRPAVAADSFRLAAVAHVIRELIAVYILLPQE